jgi:hypothetical protein
VNHLWDEKAQELREAVRRAYDAYHLAVENSKAIIKEGPHALPYPDGVQRMTNAEREERYALDEYVKALQEFNNYANRKP